jgi:hypothetical protein
MADYNEMKEKLRRDGMAEQKSKFMSTMGVMGDGETKDANTVDAYQKMQESVKSYKSGQDASAMKAQAEQLKAKAAEMAEARKLTPPKK